MKNLLSISLIVFFAFFTSSLNAQIESKNGNTLSPHGTIRILVIFAEIHYNSGVDPFPFGTDGWPAHQLPAWKDQLLDPTVTTNPQGMLTKFFKEASFGDFNVIGDYLINPLDPDMPVVLEYSGTTNSPADIINAVHSQYGTFTTENNFLISDFDYWSLTGEGLPKHYPSMDSPMKYDHIMYITRNSDVWDYQGQDGPGTWGSLFGYDGNTYMWINASNGNPFSIAKHEFSHLIIGDNTFHIDGGAVDNGNFFTPLNFTWGTMTGAHATLFTCNAWDRDRLDWKGPGKIMNISARNSSNTNEINGDLDATNPSDGGTYILRDFVTTGDAIRIKLPYLTNGEFPEWLWIENHRTRANNGSMFDKLQFQDGSCVDDATPGLYMYIQIDKNTKTGADTYGGYTNYLYPMPASGFHDCFFENAQQQNNCENSEYAYPFYKLPEYENPLSGNCYQQKIARDEDNNSLIINEEGQEPYIEKIGTNYIKRLPQYGTPEMAFTINGNNKIGIGTNPSSSNVMNIVQNNGPIDLTSSPKKNNRKILLNGLSLEILNEEVNGNITVQIQFDNTDVDNDVRWCAEEIVLNPISSSSGYSLNLKTGKTINIDQGYTPQRINKITNTNALYDWAYPTVFTCKSNSIFNMEEGSFVNVNSGSTYVLESNSTLNINNNSIFKVESNGTLIINSGSNVNIEGTGKIVVEDGGYLCIESGANINLEDPTSLIELKQFYNIGVSPSFNINPDFNFGNHICLNVCDINYSGQGYVKLPFDETTVQINFGDNITWQTNKSIEEYIFITDGGRLNIESTVKFAKNAKIYIEQGGILNINGGLLTSICPNKDQWLGIEIWGNGNFSQLPVSGVYNQGIVEIKNGGTIENAVCGIYVGERDVNGDFVQGTGGGIVRASTGAMFKGNKVDVQFEPYILQGANNLSYFYDSFFEYAFNLPQGVDGPKSEFIQLNGVKGVSIGGCEFTNTSTLYGHTQHGVGILGTNAGFNASAANHYIGGELVAAPNKFEGLISGVWAAGDLLPINVNNNTFINNYCGVGLVGIKNAKVVGNDFDIGTIGLYLDQCTGYTVEENTFGSGGTTASCGIGVWNSGITANMLYKNTFEDIIGAPIYIEGENGYFSNWMMRSNVGSIPAPHPPYFYSGLEIRCNSFDLTQAVYDITVKTDPATGLGSISPFQGSWEMPAGNQFGDASVINNIATDPGVLPFTYYYYTNQEPTILVGSTTVTKILISTENTCPTHTGGGNCPTCLLDDISTLSYLLPPMINPILNGNRESLMEDIKSAGSSQGMTLATLTDTLMAVSPYLADTVLMAAIGKYDTVEPTMLKQVMIANSPLTLKVKAMLDKKKLSDSIKQEIDAAQTGFSARYVLEKQIHDSTTKLSLAENELMSIYLNDTNIVGIDSVIHYLVEKNSHESKLMLVEAYYAKGDSLGLLAALDSLELNNRADSLFGEYFGIMADLKTDGKSLYEIDSMQAQSIREIAATQTEAGAYAKGVLALVYGEIPPIVFGKINVADNLTIRGHLKGGLCSNYLPIAGDTIAMIDTAFAMVENVTPVVTDAAGYFKFDLYDLIHLNTSATYSFVSKSGLVYTDTVFRTVNQWIGSDTLELRLEKVKAYFSFDTLRCLPNYEHFTSMIKYGLEPYTYDWIGKDSIRLDSTIVQEAYTQGQLSFDWIVSDVLGCSDTVHINLDYLVDLPQCPTISGTLYESFDCGENIMPFDTLLIVDYKNNRVDSITPVITGSDGSFKFDIEELRTLKSTALFNIASKSGFALESMEPKTIDDWINSSPLTLKAANVHQQWVATYIGPDSINDNATALDLADNIYVVGVSTDSSGQQFAVIKYDSLGVQQWVSRLDEALPDMSIYMSAIAVDSESNVYIAGALRYKEDSNSVNSLIVAKINSSGEGQWGALYDNFTWLNSGNLSITGLYIDNENNVLVGCNSRGGRYSEPGFIIVKYDPEGDLLWAIDNKIIENENISMNSMVVNSSDYILVSGKIASNWEEGGKYLTAVISPTGYLMWYRTYPYSKIGNSQYEATSNALGTDGLYITGFNGRSEDSITTLKYSPWVGDTAIWVKTLTAADLGYDIINGKCVNKMLIDEYDNTYIYGTGWNGDNSSLYIFMYDNAGELLWVKDHIKYENNTINVVNSAVISNDGNIYMTGFTGNSNDTTTTYNYLTTKIGIEDEGEPAWTTTYKGPANNDIASCVKVSRNGNVYVTGGSQRETNSGTEYATVKYAQCPSKANLRQMSGTSANTIETKTNSVKVYPNPTKDEFYVEYNGDAKGQKLEVELYTIYGALMKHVYVNGVNKMTVSTRDLAAGIYFYHVNLDNTTIGKDKIVVIK